MGKASSVEIVYRGAMNLSFCLEATKSRRVKHTRTIALIRATMVITPYFMFIVISMLPFLFEFKWWFEWRSQNSTYQIDFI